MRGGIPHGNELRRDFPVLVVGAREDLRTVHKEVSGRLIFPSVSWG